MKISKSSENLISMIKHYEGVELQAYPDPGTKSTPYTLGFGSTFYENGNRVKMGDSITLERAVSLLQHTLKNYERDVDNMTRDDINQGQFDALVDFAYNCGAKNLQNSTLLKLVNLNPNTIESRISFYNGVPKQMNLIQIEFLKWDRANNVTMRGLAKRRASEWILYSQNKLILT